MKILIFSLVCCTYYVSASGQSPIDGRATTGSAEQDLRSGHHVHKTRPQHETTMKGCLLGQNGKYILITSKQSSVLQLVATANLGVHEGHTVKITGVVEDVTAPPAFTASPDEVGASTPTEILTSGHLRVRKITTISATCEPNSDEKKKSWRRILNL